MRHSLPTLGALMIPLAFVSCVAHHNCSGQEMIAMKERGFSADEVTNNCTSYKIQDGLLKIADQAMQTTLAKNASDQASPPAGDSNTYRTVSTQARRHQAMTCATQVGQCPLTQSVFSGLACTCPTRFGPLPGVTR